MKHRRVTLNEKLYAIAEEIFPSFAIQLVIKGEGILAIEELSASLEPLKKSIPALGYRMQGKYWVDGGLGPKIIVHKEEFNNDLNGDIFRSAMDAGKGETCEIHVFHAENTTLVIRVLHSLMDGVGLLTFLDQWFDILNKKQVEDLSDFPSEHEFTSKLDIEPKKHKSAFRFKYKALEPISDEGFQYINDCVQLEGKVEGLVSKLAHWFSQQTGAESKFLVPVNVRRHRADYRSIANLSMPFYLEASPEESELDLQTKLLKELAENNELSSEPLEKFGRSVPSTLLTAILKRRTLKAQSENAFPLSGFLSDMGYVDLGRISTENFICTDLIPIPVYVPLAPFCVFSCYHSAGTRVGISVPASFNSPSIVSDLNTYLSDFISHDAAEYEDEFSAIGLKLRDIWAEILHIPSETIHSNSSYSSLGGGSLNLLLMVHRIETEIVEDRSKKIMAQVIKEGGQLTISGLEELIKKIEH